MNYFKFELKIRPEWDNGEVVPVLDDKEEPTGKFTVKFETEPDTRLIQIIQPFAPSTFAQVLRHMGNKESELAGELILSQYMYCETDEDKKLCERIRKDGRLLYSCMEAMSPIFDLCETELKKV